jgi:hypothetical protein
MSFMRSEINALLALVFVGSFTLGAALIIWHAATNTNPLADALVPLVQQ